MSDGTLLAHVSNRLGHGTENLATEALEYVLRHQQVADAFSRHVRIFAPELPKLTRFRTQVAGDDDAGIRDLVGSTAENTTPLVVEAKFDAPLTPNQPATYLRALSELDVETLLLFLTPTSKVSQLWPRLLRRCAEEGLVVTPTEDGAPVGRAGSVTMAVTTWGRLLDDLSGIPLSEGNSQVLGEILQLRGLCAREDREGFAPFGSEFLEGVDGARLVQLNSLIIEAVEQLQQAEKATTKGYKWSAGHDWFGKYFRLAGHPVLLHANFLRWGFQADTPLWLRVYPGSDPRVGDTLSALRNAEPRRLFDADGKLQIPVFLPPDGDREDCLAEIVRTVVQVHDLLAELPQVESSVTQDLDLEDLTDDRE